MSIAELTMATALIIAAIMVLLATLATAIDYMTYRRRAAADVKRTELPDFTTATAWMDALGGVATQRQIMDYRGPLSDFSSGSPWTPLDTAGGWAKRIDPHELAGVLDGCFPGCDGPAAEDFIERYVVSAVPAVIAALPELMGDTTKEEA